MFHLDEHEINVDHELCNIPKEDNYFLFRVKLFLHILRSQTPGRDIYLETDIKQFTIPRREYFEQSLTQIHDMLMSGLGLGSDLTNYVAPKVASFVKEVIEEVTENNTDSRIQAFSLNFHAVTPNYDNDDQEDQDYQIELATRESMDMFPTVPATESSIEALKIESLRDISTTEKYCSICLEKLVSDMKDGEDDRPKEMARMPCSHLYHKDCINRWLRTSHLCPLCRHAMPTSP